MASLDRSGAVVGVFPVDGGAVVRDLTVMLAAGELLLLVARGPQVVEAVVLEAEQAHVPHVLGVDAAPAPVVPEAIQQAVEPALLRGVSLVVGGKLERASLGWPVGHASISRSGVPCVANLTSVGPASRFSFFGSSAFGISTTFG